MDSKLNPHVQGKESDRWMCVDAGTIGIHFFTQEGRDYVEMEKLWAMKHHPDEYSDDIDPADMENAEPLGGGFETVGTYDNYDPNTFQSADGSEQYEIVDENEIQAEEEQTEGGVK